MALELSLEDLKRIIEEEEGVISSSIDLDEDNEFAGLAPIEDEEEEEEDLITREDVQAQVTDDGVEIEEEREPNFEERLFEKVAETTAGGLLIDSPAIASGLAAGVIDFYASAISGTVALQDYLRTQIFTGATPEESLQQAGKLIEEFPSLSRLVAEKFPPTTEAGKLMEERIQDAFHTVFKKSGELMAELAPDDMPNLKAAIATGTEAAVLTAMHFAGISAKKAFNKVKTDVKERVIKQVNKGKDVEVTEFDKAKSDAEFAILETLPEDVRTPTEKTSTRKEKISKFEKELDKGKLSETELDELLDFVEKETGKPKALLPKDTEGTVQAKETFAEKSTRAKKALEELKAKEAEQVKTTEPVTERDKILRQREIEKRSQEAEFQRFAEEVKGTEGAEILQKAKQENIERRNAEVAENFKKGEKLPERDIPLDRERLQAERENADIDQTNRLLKLREEEAIQKQKILDENKKQIIDKDSVDKLIEETGRFDLDIERGGSARRRLETEIKNISKKMKQQRSRMDTAKTQRATSIARNKLIKLGEQAEVLMSQAGKPVPSSFVDILNKARFERDQLLKEQKNRPKPVTASNFILKLGGIKSGGKLGTDLSFSAGKAGGKNLLKKNGLEWDLVQRALNEAGYKAGDTIAGFQEFLSQNLRKKFPEGSIAESKQINKQIKKELKEQEAADLAKKAEAFAKEEATQGKQRAVREQLNKERNNKQREIEDQIYEQQNKLFDRLVNAKEVKEKNAIRREINKLQDAKNKLPKITEDPQGFQLHSTYSGIEFISKTKNNIIKLSKSLKRFVKHSKVGGTYRIVNDAVTEFVTGSNVGAFYAQDAMRKILDLVPDIKDRTTITNIIDRKLPLEQLPAKSRAVAVRIREMLDRYAIRMKEAGIIDKFEENYLPHLIKLKAGLTKKRRERTLQELSEFLEQGILTERKIGKDGTKFSLDKLEKQGYTVERDIVNIIGNYVMQAESALANKRFADFLVKHRLPNGDPLLVDSAFLKKNKISSGESFEKMTDYVEINSLDLFNWSQGTKGTRFDRSMFIHKDGWALVDNVIQRANKDGNFFKSYKLLKSGVKRFVMFNPLVHGWNVESNVFMAIGLKSWLANRVAPALKLKKSRLGRLTNEEIFDLQREMVRNGVELEGLYDKTQQLRNDRYVLSAPESKTLAGMLRKKNPIAMVRELGDTILWDKWVKSGQMIIYADLKAKMMTDGITVKHNIPLLQRFGRRRLNEAEAGKAAAAMVNDFSGTLPKTWFTRSQRDALNILLFARNWNVGLARTVTGMMGSHASMKYLPKPLRFEGFTDAQLKSMGSSYRASIVRGMVGAYVTTQVIQNMFYKYEGLEEEMHSITNNEYGRKMDIDTGRLDSKGGVIHIRNWMFRAMHDYAKALNGRPLDFVTPKLEPVMRVFASLILNAKYGGRPIVPEGVTDSLEKMSHIGKFMIQGFTPLESFTGREDQVRTWLETMIIYTGTYTSSGVKAGVTDPKLRKELSEFQNEWLPKYKFMREEKRNEMNLLIRQGDIAGAMDLVVNNPLLVSDKSLEFQLEKTFFPMLQITRGTDWMTYMSLWTPDRVDNFFSNLAQDDLNRTSLPEQD